MNIQTATASAPELRRTLLGAGLPTRGLSVEQMRSECFKLTGSDDPLQAPAAPMPPPALAPAIEPKRVEAAPPHAPGIQEAITAAITAAIAATPSSLNEERVIEIVREHAAAPRNICVQPLANIDPVLISGAHKSFPDLLDVLSIQENAYLVGPSGSGKTTLGQQAAKALGVEFYSTGAVLDKFELTGFVDAGGRYHRTGFRNAVEHGGLFLWDEVDSSLPQALNYFNSALENGFIAFPDGVTIEINREKTFFVTSANTIGTGANRSYVGRYELDRAFLDRFMQITVEYDSDVERDMGRHAWLRAGGAEAGIHKADAWVASVRKFRALLNDRGIIALCTPRASRRGAALLARGWSMSKVRSVELYKHLSHDQCRQLNLSDADCGRGA